MVITSMENAFSLKGKSDHNRRKQGHRLWNITGFCQQGANIAIMARR